MLRRVARGTRNQIRRWLDGGRGPLDHWAAPYTLNASYSHIMSQPGCGHDYAWGMTQAINLARVLGIQRVSVIEFGVAGGNGLLTLEAIAEQMERIFGVGIDVFGFDTGVGLTKPSDNRDMPNLWSEGFFPMEVAKLKSRLRRAELVIGPVAETVPKFVSTARSPLAFAAFDVDLYSSTKSALEVFDSSSEFLLPRVHCYFDDILGYTFGDHVGERLAISDFNDGHETRKLSPIYGLRYYVPKMYAHLMWEKQYMLHVFDHDAYAHYDKSIPGGDVLSLGD